MSSIARSCAVVVLSFVSALGFAGSARGQTAVTFARDIAPIVFSSCSSCHRPGGSASFSLLTYADVHGRAQAIAAATRTRSMPPWKPEPGYGEFAGARRLTARQIYNIIWTQNLAIPFSQYTLTSVPNPQAPGQTLPVYNVNSAVFGQVNELDTNSDQNTRVDKGVDVSINWRLPGGGSLTGGTSTGRLLTNTCDVADPNNTRFCDYNQYEVPLQTVFKLSGTYPLPHGIRPCGTFQHTPAAERTITYQVTRTQLPTLVAASVNIRLNEPGSVYNDTVNSTSV